ncbi:carbohydrate-binding module family 13 protein [Boletus coccyginus]|nr:carbohydrate-binding module family 13 protein [Boletus coccyginus]
MACIQSGHKYALINVKGGTALDLSGGDNRSIIGFPYHGGPNQEWYFEKAGEDHVFYIKSAESSQPKYLTSAGGLHDGQKVVVDDAPFPWCVEDVGDRVIRISPESNRNFCVDLSDYGNAKPGTPVELWGRWDGDNQKWRLKNE